MKFWTFHAPHRLYRLRRLLFVCLLIFATGLLVGVGFSGPDALLLDVSNLAALMIAAAGVFANIVVIYPHSWVALMALSIILAVAAALIPGIEWLFDGLEDSKVVPGAVFGGMLVIVAGFYALFGLARMFTYLVNIPVGERLTRRSLWLPMPPSEAFEAFTFGPNKRGPNWVTDPIQEDGSFVYRFGFHYPKPDATSKEFFWDSFEATMKILERGNLSQTTLFILNSQDSPKTGVSVVKFEPAGEGTLYIWREQHDFFSLYSDLDFWLNDTAADQMRAAVDYHLNRDSPALLLLPRYTFLHAIAHCMSKNQDGPDF